MEFPARIALQAAVILVGAAFITAWRRFAWGPAALMAGVFFITIGIITILIELASVPGFWQPALASPLFAIIAMGALVLLMIITVVVGLLQTMGILRRGRR